MNFKMRHYLVVTAVEQGGRRQYSFQSALVLRSGPEFDDSEFLFEHISLHDNVDKIFGVLVADIWRQLST